MQNIQKTSYWQDTNVYISESKLAGDLKIGHYTEMYSSFFSWDVILLETEWNLEKIDESVNKHTKHTKYIVLTGYKRVYLWKWS